MLEQKIITHQDCDCSMQVFKSKFLCKIWMKNNAEHFKRPNIPFLYQIWLAYPIIKKKKWNFKKLGFDTF